MPSGSFTYCIVTVLSPALLPPSAGFGRFSLSLFPGIIIISLPCTATSTSTSLLQPSPERTSPCFPSSSSLSFYFLLLLLFTTTTCSILLSGSCDSATFPESVWSKAGLHPRVDSPVCFRPKPPIDEIDSRFSSCLGLQDLRVLLPCTTHLLR